jgi:hypothetical protein
MEARFWIAHICLAKSFEKEGMYGEASRRAKRPGSFQSATRRRYLWRVMLCSFGRKSERGSQDSPIAGARETTLCASLQSCLGVCRFA